MYSIGNTLDNDALLVVMIVRRVSRFKLLQVLTSMNYVVTASLDHGFNVRVIQVPNLVTHIPLRISNITPLDELMRGGCDWSIDTPVPCPSAFEETSKLDYVVFFTDFDGSL